MKLMELLEKIDESKNVNILLDGELITYYDGKNSIDELYNTYNVLCITCENDTMIIELY